MSVEIEAHYKLKHSFAFEFEENFDNDASIAWINVNKHFSVLLVFLYVVLIFFGKKYMEDRPAFQLRKPLFFWNVVLAIFSIIGTFRMVPELLYVLQEFGFQYSICSSSYANVNKVSALWGSLFILSKAVELGDTFFLVAKKRNVIFLHWYHHAIVTIGCWYSMAETPGYCRWFISMNYTVHGLMYSYFAFQAMRVQIPRIFSVFLTTLQIIQMVVGAVVCVYAVYYSWIKGECVILTKPVVFFLLQYLSFFILFFNFFVQSYLKRKKA